MLLWLDYLGRLLERRPFKLCAIEDCLTLVLCKRIQKVSEDDFSGVFPINILQISLILADNRVLTEECELSLVGSD